MSNDLPDWTRQGVVPVFVQNIQGQVGGTAVQNTLPAEAVGVQFIATAVDFTSHIKLVGVFSGKIYLDVGPLNLLGVYNSGTLDSRDLATNGIIATISNSASVQVLEFFLCAGASFVGNSPTLPLWVTATTAAGIATDPSDRLTRQLGRVVPVTSGNATITPDDVGGGIVSLGASLKNATPAPWQSGNKAPFLVSVSIAALGTSVIVPAVAGQTVRLFSASLAIDTPVATGEVQLQDTAGTGYHSFSVGSNICNPFFGEGEALPVGLGVQLKNNMGANAAVMRGSIVVSQN